MKEESSRTGMLSGYFRATATKLLASKRCVRGAARKSWTRVPVWKYSSSLSSLTFQQWWNLSTILIGYIFTKYSCIITWDLWFYFYLFGFINHKVNGRRSFTYFFTHVNAALVTRHGTCQAHAAVMAADCCEPTSRPKYQQLYKRLFECLLKR